MNSDSLNKEIKNFKHYLKKISKTPGRLSRDERKNISFTLIGMIVSINNHFNSGAFGYQTPEEREVAALVNDTRNIALHYGYFSESRDIIEVSKKLDEHLEPTYYYNMPDHLDGITLLNNTYTFISPKVGTIVEPSILLSDYYTLRTGDPNSPKLYVKKEDLIVLTNSLGVPNKYLLLNTEEKAFLLKEGSNETISINSSELKAHEIMSKFEIGRDDFDLKHPLKKLLSELKDDPYANMTVSVKYNDTVTSFTAYKVLQDLVFNSEIDEKIAAGKYTLAKYSDEERKEIDVGAFPIKALAEKATLSDALYIDLFVKQYVRMKKKIAEYQDENNFIYAKQSMYLDLLSLGFSSLSTNLINADREENFQNLYHAIRRMRNNLAHTPLTPEQKSTLFSTLEYYTDCMYDIFSKVINYRCHRKSTGPMTNFSKIRKTKDNEYIVSGNDNMYYSLNHNGYVVIFNGKKYLKILNDETNNCFLELNPKSYFSLKYDNLISNKIVTPVNGARFVKLDFDREKSTKINYRPKESVKLDTSLLSLQEAFEYYKTHPQYRKSDIGPYCVAITFYDKTHGSVRYTEKLQNLLLRNLHHKIIPASLSTSFDIVLSNNIDDPMKVVDKDGALIATIYLASLNTDRPTDEKAFVSQLLANGDKKEIEYGKLLPKDLQTDDLTIVKKR